MGGGGLEQLQAVGKFSKTIDRGPNYSMLNNTGNQRSGTLRSGDQQDKVSQREKETKLGKIKERTKR